MIRKTDSAVEPYANHHYHDMQTIQSYSSSGKVDLPKNKTPYSILIEREFSLDKNTNVQGKMQISRQQSKNVRAGSLLMNEQKKKADLESK
jgi:hypothetical protein